MNRPLVFALPGNEDLAGRLVRALDAELGALTARNFPDGETYLRFDTDPRERRVVVACTLNDPNAKILPVLFAAQTARDLGAARIGLVAPYLAYMRQDKSFQPREAVTSRHLASLISRHFDWLVTIDPHLHRYHRLAEIYSIPAIAEHAAPLLSDWIARNVEKPFLIGPDGESAQWVSETAAKLHAPFVTLTKTRKSDRDVETTFPDLAGLENRTPVLLDDIISTGRTMLTAIRHLRDLTAAVPVCIAVHGIFADRSDALLAEAGARLVTTNSIPHASNGIDVSSALAQAIKQIGD